MCKKCDEIEAIRRNLCKFAHVLMISIKLMIDDLLRKFSQARVLVIGDVMIDAYLKGNVGRISPEAPVIIAFFFISRLYHNI